MLGQRGDAVTAEGRWSEIRRQLTRLLAASPHSKESEESQEMEKSWGRGMREGDEGGG